MEVNDMDISKLNEFNSITKKAEAAQTKKIGFQEELIKLLNEEGYSVAAEKFLFEGFLLGGANAFVRFLKTKTGSDKDNIYHDFTSGYMFNKNEKGISFKIITALFGLLINERDQNTEIISDIVRRMNGLSKNKENKRHSDASKTIEKYLVCLMNPDIVLPDLSQLGLMPAALEKFRELMNDALCEMKPSSPREVANSEKIKYWITGNVSNDSKSELQIKENEKAKESIISYKVDEKKQSRVHQLISLAKYLESLEKENENLKKKNDLLKNECEGYVAKNELVIKENENLRVSLIKQTSQIEELHQEKLSLKIEIDEKNNQISKMNEDIKKRNAVLSVYETDKKNSQMEQLNAIASKLKVEYIDFLDATEMEMTVDLGENMRQQLYSIFKILMKNGVDLERR